jgi:hypothetical protein
MAFFLIGAAAPPQRRGYLNLLALPCLPGTYLQHNPLLATFRMSTGHSRCGGRGPRHFVFVGRINKGCEQRMRGERFRFEFRMELASQEPGVVRDLNDLYEILIRGHAGNNQAAFGQRLFKLPIKFVSMPMPFRNHR